MRRIAFSILSVLLALSLVTGHMSVATLADESVAASDRVSPDEAPPDEALPDEAADEHASSDTAPPDAEAPEQPAQPEPPAQSEPPAQPEPAEPTEPNEPSDPPEQPETPEPAEPLEPTGDGPPVMPEDVRGIYLTAYAAADRAWASSLIRLIQETELNAIVIDVKNDSGHISLVMPDGTGGVVPDLADLVARLKRRNIYTIARIVVFKDPVAASKWPELTARTTAGAVWRDYSGIAWLDPYNTDAWAFNIEVALQAAALGFDEIQFDYVRFPSDGNVRDLVYPENDGRRREEVIADFLSVATAELHAVGVNVSADVFGLVTSTEDDMGIGQLLEPLAEATDVLSPMVYPSHYGAGNYGLPNPNAAPYETVSRGLQDALQRLGPDGTKKLRPWLQDFSLGHPYGPAEVRAQIQATEELGIRQWLLWNAANVYTRAALGPPAAAGTPPVTPE